jgi:hypothetical protein
MRAFTIFLQEGSSHPDSRLEQSDVAMEAIGAAVFELAYRQPREDSEATLSRLLAPVVFISLAPFLGVDAAGDFVCRKAFHERPPLTSAA